MQTAITIILALFAFVLTILGATWMSNRATERNFDLLNKRMDERDKRMDVVLSSLEKRFDARFASVESRLDRIERQLEAIFKPMLPPR